MSQCALFKSIIIGRKEPETWRNMTFQILCVFEHLPPTLFFTLFGVEVTNCMDGCSSCSHEIKVIQLVLAKYSTQIKLPSSLIQVIRCSICVKWKRNEEDYSGKSNPSWTLASVWPEQIYSVTYLWCIPTPPCKLQYYFLCYAVLMMSRTNA